MYADADAELELLLLLHWSQGHRQDMAATDQYLPSPDDDDDDDFQTSCFYGAAPHWDNLVQTSSLSEYDLGGEGDLFKAPEPVLEEPVLASYPITAAMSMTSNNENLIIPEAIKVAHMESIQNEDLLSEVFYQCKKDFLAKSAIMEPFPEASDVKIPAVQPERDPGVEENKLVTEGPMPKSVSFGCLSSVDYGNSCNVRPSFLDFQAMNLGDAFGIRRTYSEGDIQTLGNNKPLLGNLDIVHSFEHLSTIGNGKIAYKIEERRQKLSRYRKKRTKRNFGRKIKYACRKALADSQPRVRGRFVKSDECEVSSINKI